MANRMHVHKYTLWAVYYEGHFSHYRTEEVDMSEQEGWVKIKDVTLTFEHDQHLQPTVQLVAQLKAKALLMQATFEAAHSEVLNEINKLLAIGMDKSDDDTDLPF